MIEVNRKLYMDEETGDRGPDFADVKALLGQVIRADWTRVSEADHSGAACTSEGS